MRLHVEVPFFLIIFAFAFSDPITINLIVYRTCYVTLGHNKSECAQLGSGKTDNATVELEQEVQLYASVLSTTKYLTEIFISAIICFFVGPWSDKYGRRPVLLYTLGGYTFGYLIITIISALPNTSPWFLLLPAIPISIFGGFPANLTVTICYITDSTTQRSRGLRMGIFEALLTTGLFLGTLSSSFVYNAYGYLTMYSITSLCIFSAWLSVMVAIPESVENVQPSEGRFRELFRLSLVKRTFEVTFRQRNGHDRRLLLMVITLLVIFLLAVTADGSIVFLYLRRKLQWSLQEFTLFNSERQLAWVGGSILGGCIMHKLLNVEETVLILLGFLSVMSSALLQGLAIKDWHMFVAGAVKCFGGAISPMCRTLISKIASPEDCGKIFSFVVVIETFVSLLGSSIYTFLYNETIATLPGAFNFVTAGIYAVEIVLTIPVIVMQVRRQREEYQNLSQEDEASN